MKVAVITDTHWGARADSREFLNHMVQFYRKIFFPELQERGIQTILHLGDIMEHRKFVNYVTLNALRKEFIERSSELGIGIHILVGNHDIPYRNTNEVNAMREIFGKHNHVKLYWEPEEIEIESARILMMPWINSSNQERCFEAMKRSKAECMFGHLHIRGFEMHRGVPAHDGFAPDLFKKFQVVASGHFHKKSHYYNIQYLGAPYEMTWSDYNCPRGFHIFDTETLEFEYIRNPMHMFNKVFYSDDNDEKKELLANAKYDYLKDSYVKVVVRAKDDPFLFDTIMTRIYAANPIDVVVVDDHRNMQAMSEADILNETEDTLTILHDYVETISTQVDKIELDNLLKSLYNEAMELDMVDESQW